MGEFLVQQLISLVAFFIIRRFSRSQEIQLKGGSITTSMAVSPYGLHGLIIHVSLYSGRYLRGLHRPKNALNSVQGNFRYYRHFSIDPDDTVHFDLSQPLIYVDEALDPLPFH